MHAVITHDNTSNGIKISTFLEKVGGMMLYLSSAPLKFQVNLSYIKQDQDVIIP